MLLDTIVITNDAFVNRTIVAFEWTEELRILSMAWMKSIRFYIGEQPAKKDEILSGQIALENLRDEKIWDTYG